ncbi:MAG: hypothetical protein ACHRHE_05225 [Tepidisphaerales bacterium]
MITLLVRHVFCCLLLAAIATAATAQDPAKPSPSPQQLTLKQLKNMTYKVEDATKGKAVLRNGKFADKPFEPGAASRLEVFFGDKVAHGDLNGDGSSDAAVILWENSGGSGTFVHLAAVINEGGKPRHIASECLGDRVNVQALSIKGGIITVEILTQGAHDAMPDPTVPETHRFLLDGGRLIPDEGLIRPWAADVYRAFPQIQPRPEIQQKLPEILVAMDAADSAQRDAASRRLEALGNQGVLAVLRLDRSALSPEQRNRIASAIKAQSRCPLATEDLREDPAFLISCLEFDDPSVRELALASLRSLFGQDLAASPQALHAAADALRKQLASKYLGLPPAVLSLLNHDHAGWEFARVPRDTARFFAKTYPGRSPVVIRGDFDGNGRLDYAALVTVAGQSRVLVFLRQPGGGWKQTSLEGGWDYLLARPRGATVGVHEPGVTLKTDAIEGNLFEKSAWTFHLEKDVWQKVCTSD